MGYKFNISYHLDYEFSLSFVEPGDIVFDWIFATGFWNDAGVWDDTQTIP